MFVKQRVLSFNFISIYNGLKNPWAIVDFQLISNRGKQYTITIAIPITWRGKYLSKFLKLAEQKGIEFTEQHPKRIFESITSISNPEMTVDFNRRIVTLFPPKS